MKKKNNIGNGRDSNPILDETTSVSNLISNHYDDDTTDGLLDKSTFSLDDINNSDDSSVDAMDMENTSVYVFNYSKCDKQRTTTEDECHRDVSIFQMIYILKTMFNNNSIQ